MFYIAPSEDGVALPSKDSNGYERHGLGNLSKRQKCSIGSVVTLSELEEMVEPKNSFELRKTGSKKTWKKVTISRSISGLRERKRVKESVCVH